MEADSERHKLALHNLSLLSGLKNRTLIEVERADLIPVPVVLKWFWGNLRRLL